MPTKLSSARKQAMQEGRKTARDQRDHARETLENNPQFTNPTFWKKIPPTLIQDVKRAIERAEIAAKKAEIAKLRRRIAKLEDEI